MGDDHALGAPQRPAVLQPAELQLLGGRGLHLTADLHLPANLNVVVIVVGVGRDPEATFAKACGGGADDRGQSLVSQKELSEFMLKHHETSKCLRQT